MAMQAGNPTRAARPSEADALLLFASDVRTALLLLNEARYRGLARIFGVSRTQANVVTVIGLVALADATRDRVNWLLNAPGTPASTDGFLSGAVAEELFHEVAGPSSRTTPFLGAIVMAGLLHGRTRPVILRTVRLIGTTTRDAHQFFELHYRRRVQPTRVGRALTAARDVVGKT
jgi:hypothetical protein